MINEWVFGNGSRCSFLAVWMSQASARYVQSSCTCGDAAGGESQLDLECRCSFSHLRSKRAPHNFLAAQLSAVGIDVGGVRRLRAGRITTKPTTASWSLMIQTRSPLTRGNRATSESHVQGSLSQDVYRPSAKMPLTFSGCSLRAGLAAVCNLHTKHVSSPLCVWFDSILVRPAEGLGSTNICGLTSTWNGRAWLDRCFDVSTFRRKCACETVYSSTGPYIVQGCVERFYLH